MKGMLQVRFRSLVSPVLAVAFAATGSGVRADNPAVELQAALRSIDGRDARWTAEIRTEKPESESEDGGASPMAMVLKISSRDVSSMKVFTGTLDVHLGGDGAIAAATPGGLPQVSVMHDGEQQLLRQTYDETAYDLPKLIGLLRETLNVPGLIDELSQVNRVRVKESGGSKIYRITLDGDYFDSDSGGNDPKARIMAMAVRKMQPSVMEGVLQVTVDASGSPTRMDYALQYSDPMKGIMSQAMKGAGGGGQMKIQVFGGGIGSGEEVPGEKILVRFDRDQAGGGPAKAFAEEAGKLLEASGG